MKSLKLLLLFSWISVFHFAGFAQPNDNCSGATSLGTLPTPAVACIGGVRNGNPTTLTGQSTVGATAASPYIYQTGCTGGTMTTFALDTWYSFVATGTTANVNITGFPNANVALYAGTCGNLLGRGCAIGNAAGNTTLVVTQITIGQTYYIQISGNTTTATDPNFTIAVDNDIDCNDCLLNSTITASPAPVNGGYTPGQVVNFCFTVSGWSQQNTNWFHGVQISMGSAWTGAITSTVPATTQQTPSAGYNWLYYNTSPGTANGIVWPPGFYFDTNDAGTAPLNNFGDNCDGAACTWTFCWNLTVSSSCVPGGNLSVTVNTSGDGESGSWGSVACLDDPATIFNAVQICCTAPTMAMTPVSCLGGSNGTVTAAHGTGASPWNYVWTNSLGATVGTTTGSAAASNTVSGLPAGTYTVTITDNAGCVQTGTVTVTTVDVLPPTAPNPAPITVPCLANVPAPNVLVVVGEADNITAVPTVTWISDVDNGLNCPKTITRTYRVTDNCGLFINVTQQITVMPNAAPVVPANGASTVACLALATQPAAPVVTSQCGTALVPVITSNANPACEGTKVYTYTYTDCSGLSSVYTYTYTIDMTVPPVVPANGSSTVACLSAATQPASPVVTSQCGTAIVPVVTSSANPACEGTKTYTFTYTDCSGLSSVYTYTYTIDMTVPPVVPANGSSTVGCLSAATQPASPVVTSQCGTAIVPVVTSSANPACEGTKTYTFTYTDCSGLSSVYTYTYTIDMTVPPVVPANGSSTVACVTAATQPASPVVTSQCGTALVPVVTTSANPACEGTKTYTFTYTDCSGLSSVYTYTYTIDMTVPPVVPANGSSTVACATSATQPAAPVVTSQCGTALVPVITVGATPACEGTKVYTYTYTDCSGLSSVYTYTYTIDMTVAPILPANVVVNVSCSSAITVPTAPAAIDQCGNAVVPVMTQNATPVCVGNKIFTFTYTDCGGNVSVYTYTYAVNDNINPTGTAPGPISGGTTAPPPDVNLILDEADNCTPSPTVTWISDVSNGGVCPEIITRTYRITDNCGNFINVTQQISLGDAIAPTASNPAPISVNCSANVPAPDPLVVTDEADNGAPPVVTWESDVSNGASCPEVITRTYRVTDDCGNFIFVTQTITIQMTAGPVVPANGASTVACLAAATQPAAPAVTSQCGTAIVPVITSNANPACEGTKVYTYTYTDCAGAVAVYTYTYTIDMTVAPVVPANGASTVACLSAATQPAAPVVNSQCGTALVPVITASANPACEGTKVYTYTYTDCSGLVSVYTYTYTIDMVAAPVVPANGSSAIQCASNIVVPTAPVVTDACGNAIVPVMTQNATPVCVGSKIYTFTYTDCSGNSSVYTYTYTINDNVNPTASNPAPISVPGPLDVPAPNVLVVTNEADNCTASPTVAWVSDVSDGNVCNGEIITRTYSVTDDCGNQILVTQLITILATYPPIDAGPNQLICLGASATLTAINPTGAAISWSPAPVVNGVSFNPTVTTTYTVTANNLGCIATDDVTIAVDAAPVVNFDGNILSGCEPLTVTFTNNSISPSGFSNCVWTIEGATPIVGCGNITYTFQNAGTYNVTLTTTSTGGCTSSLTYTDYIYVEAAPDASFIPSSTSLSNLSTSVQFTNTSSGATSYLWDFGDGASSTLVSPAHSLPLDEPGTYTVQLIAFSPLLCSDTAWVSINVEEELIYYVPNTFTPDGDDYNEFFKPVFTAGFDPFDFNLFIYNRWGEIIWESHNAEVGWDGTYGGNLVQAGTYTWTIEFKKSKNDERVYINGHVNVIY